MSAPVIVIGGGIIGMLTARELSVAGAKVVLLERGDTGRAASWAGGGILSPLHPWRYPDAVNALVRVSQQLYPQLCAELAESTGIDPEWTLSGLLVLNADIPAATTWATEYGVATQVVEGPDIATIEPAAAETDTPALWMPDIAQVRNPRLLHALRIDLQQRGVQIVTDTTVETLTYDKSGITATTSRGTWHSATVIVAAGAWTSRLLAPYGELPVRPVKGQMIQLAGPPDTVRRIVLKENRYVIPRRDGLILIGSTLEESGFNTDITDTARDELLSFATHTFPVLRTHNLVRQWAGLRPAAPQGIPIIGPHPAVPGLFVNAGHFRNGVVMGAASAKLVVDMILSRPPAVPTYPYFESSFANLNLS